MESCDVLIVGGGPAGSSCAWKLRNAGLDVLILDKQAFPRDKLCAGWITPQVVEVLQIDEEAYRCRCTWQPIQGFRSGLINGEEVETHYERIVSYGIRRCEFDTYLLERSGARLTLNERLKSMKRQEDHWIVNGHIQAPIVIGAGGHFCPVARSLGASQGAVASVVAAQEVEFQASPEQLRRGRIEAGIPELFFCNDLKGYGWCFRKQNYLNIGLGRIDKIQLSSHVAAFTDFLREREKICCEIPTGFRGHAYQLYERTLPKLVEDGVILIGDAADLAYPQSGEGIRPAVESGLIAADTILGASSRYRRDNLEPYCDRIRARFGPPRKGDMTEWLPAAALRFLASRLLTSRWFARNVMLDRWFLHSQDAALSV